MEYHDIKRCLAKVADKNGISQSLTIEILNLGIINYIQSSPKSIVQLKPDGTSMGVLLVTTNEGDKYIVKPTLEMDGPGYIYANEIAKIMGICVPNAFRIKAKELSYSIREQLVELIASTYDEENMEYFGDFTGEDIYVTIMEYIPSSVSFEEGVISAGDCDKALESMSKILILDLFVGNYDRFYFMDSDSSMISCEDINSGNIIISNDGEIYSIDHHASKHDTRHDIILAIDGQIPITDSHKAVMNCMRSILNTVHNCTLDDTLTYMTLAVQTLKDNIDRVMVVWPDAVNIFT